MCDCTHHCSSLSPTLLPTLLILLILFLPGKFTELQPPGADVSDPGTELLLQMFMSELGMGGLDLPFPSPDPSSPPSSTLTATPPESDLSLDSPLLTPTSSLSSLSLVQPPEALACVSPSSAPDCLSSPDIDDPFLVGFADLDGLLKDANLFNTSSNSSDVDYLPSFVDPDPLFVLSDCLAVSSPSVISSSVTPETLSPSSTDSSSLLSETSVLHDHSYTSEQPATSAYTGSDTRKRKLSDATTSSSLTASSPAKKPKQKTQEETYLRRRHKNNIASQVSRAKHRANTVDMFSRVRELEETNSSLRTQIAEMEAEAAELRQKLVSKLTEPHPHPSSSSSHTHTSVPCPE